jgi:hypothetical protein
MRIVGISVSISDQLLIEALCQYCPSLEFLETDKSPIGPNLQRHDDRVTIARETFAFHDWSCGRKRPPLRFGHTPSETLIHIITCINDRLEANIYRRNKDRLGKVQRGIPRAGSQDSIWKHEDTTSHNLHLNGGLS